MTWRIGPVQDVMDGNMNFAGSGFVLHDDNGIPCVTFGFTKRENAMIGAKKMAEIIAISAEIRRST